MKHLFLFFAVMFLFMACKDTEDKLEGKWQLRQTELDGHIETVDTVYYNFLTSLFMYQIYIPATNNYQQSYGHKLLEDKKLTIDLSLQNSASFMELTDWAGEKESFTIEKISGDQLIMTNITTGKKYTFRKF
ncbi:MAG: lipocalin-like domain-containing protein [Tannerellaceae bacterium]|nr:lipocalin-like domain-containing protein [Tannerellaceae bacterium]MCD8264397.1 lipocalin-like domain-containing protein [Tannerellaceae bacterium]